MPLKQITSGSNPLATDADQFRQTLVGTADVGALQLNPPQATPAASTGSDSGSTGLLNGAYCWKTVLITGWVQSNGLYYVSGFVPSTDSAQVTVSSHYANLTGIALGGAGVIGRAIYRTLAGGAAGTEKFDQMLWNNTATTTTDNISDASLGTGMPTVLGTAIPASVPTTNTTGTQLLDCAFLSLVQKCYNNISISYSYNVNNTVNVVTITGQISATIAYAYNSNNTINKETVAITSPFAHTITTTYSYNGNGTISGESRVIS